MRAAEIRRLLRRSCIAAMILATTHGTALAWWTPEGTLVSPAPARAIGARACSDDAAGAFVAWEDGRDAHFLDPDIYAQHLLSDGTLDAAWPASARPVATAAGSQYVAGVVPDGQGGSIVVWLDTSRFGNEGYVRGDLYAIRLDPDGSLHDGWNAAGTPVDTATGVYSGGYGLTADGQGGLYVAWEDRRTGQRDIRMQHVLGNGQIPTGWPVDGVPVCSAIGDQWAPVLAPDGLGGAYVCWADYRGIAGPVYIQHVGASGLPASGWPTDGMPVRRSGAPDYEGWHTLLADDGGGAFVAWLGGDGTGNEYELRAMHLRSNGTLETGWPDAGVLLASGQGAYLGLTACHDGSGGIYLAWQDSHLSTTDRNQQDIFVARVLANAGFPSGWSVGGRAVCTKPGSQESPRITTDGIGGAYVAWTDGSDFAETGYHVYGSHIEGGGGTAPGWPVDGLLLSRPTSSQMLYSLIPDGRGGAVSIWGDYVYGAYDVIALRLEAAGIAASAFQVVDTDVGSDHVRIRWQAPSGSSYTATVERYRDGQGWSELGPPTVSSGGILEYTDRDVEPGAEYLYRLLVLTSDRVSRFYGTTTVTVPSQLRMRSPSRNPAPDIPVFEVTLAEGTARFDLFDIAGRSVWSQTLSGAGVHEIRPAPPNKLASGLYIARLQAGERVLKQRICILH